MISQSAASLTEPIASSVKDTGKSTAQSNGRSFMNATLDIGKSVIERTLSRIRGEQESLLSEGEWKSLPTTQAGNLSAPVAEKLLLSFLLLTISAEAGTGKEPKRNLTDLRTSFEESLKRVSLPDTEFSVITAIHPWVTTGTAHINSLKCDVCGESFSGIKVLRMELDYALEMVCDWIGAGLAQGHGRDVRSWYEKNKSKMQMEPCTRLIVEVQLLEE